MAQAQEVEPKGRRRVPTREDVAKRVKKTPRLTAPEGVTSLNPGFFLLESMRTSTVTKVKSGKRREIREN